MGISIAAQLERANVRVGWTTNVRPTWAFDLDAIRQACEYLGVRAPVVVGCVEWDNRRGRGGMHSYERGEHRIKVRRASDAERASRTLWHELSHAAQHDRGVKGGTLALRKSAGHEAYMNDPREVEAREAEAWHHSMPLTRPL